MRARRLSGYLAILAIAWNPISWVVTTAGLVDPDHWLSRSLFWPQLSVIMTTGGLVWLAILARRPVSDRKVASELNQHADWAIQNLRDRRIEDAAEEAELHRDYGRWHQRVEDQIAPFERRVPREHAAFVTLETHLSVDPLEGISQEHSRLKGMIEFKVTRLRTLARAIRDAGWLD